MSTSTSVDHTAQEYADEIAQLKRELYAARHTEDVARQQVAPLAFTDLLALCDHKIAEF